MVKWIQDNFVLLLTAMMVSLFIGIAVMAKYFTAQQKAECAERGMTLRFVGQGSVCVDKNGRVFVRGGR